ncbi:MAG: ABC transporter permease [Oscillospiraceae bacterium]|nr:ABC transporter permease [Oscillospiraceae bacterium]
MNTVAVAFQCELKKIFWRPKYIVILIIYALIGLGTGMFATTGDSLGTASGIFFSLSGPNALYSALSTYRMFLIPLAVFMLAADIFTHELESKSVKCVLLRPVSRFDAYLAKCLAMLCYIAIALGAGFVVLAARQVISAAIAGTTANPYGLPAALRAAPGAAAGAASQGLTALSVLSMLGEALASYLLTLAPMAAYIAFASFVAVLIRSPALVMFLCIVSYLVFAFFGTFNSSVGAALFTTYTGWYRMWLGHRLPWQSLLTTAGLLLSTSVVFFGFGYFLFDKKDI